MTVGIWKSLSKLLLFKNLTEIVSLHIDNVFAIFKQ